MNKIHIEHGIIVYTIHGRNKQLLFGFVAWENMHTFRLIHIHKKVRKKTVFQSIQIEY